MKLLRYPIEKPTGRKLRVLEYARYSTEEQHPSSIADQFSFCTRFLASAGVEDPDIEQISDPETSGELVSRPGIDQVKDGIRTRRWDLLLVEDSSRLFRHETACGDLIEKAVDQGIRVIAINDDVDTAEEDWEDPLHESTRHHARTNRYTAKRIKRKLMALWGMGAAVGHLRPGYLRKATNPDAEERRKKGPFFDEVDPRWAPVVYGAYERITIGDPPWRVGQGLTEQGLPKASKAASNTWTAKDVIALIKNPVYRGVEVYRAKIVRKHYGSGEHRLVPNNPKEILTREMSHLRLVPDWLWYDANQKIKKRMTRAASDPGAAHPLSGVPRDSREPL
jgi:DNA invertase Pin-like site-specific DNA recombinase